MPDQAINVFISYSHADASLVGPVVKLMRVNKALVFQDTDQITPGKKWREEIERGVTEANMVVVFWCRHAFESSEVAGEWQRAIDLDKDVLPLLLDETPLPSGLSQYQYIDFRGTVGADHGRRDIPPPARSAPPVPKAGARPFQWMLLTGAVVAVILVAGYLLMMVPEGSPFPPPPSGDSPLSRWLIAVAAIAAGVVAHRWWRRQRRPRAVETTLGRGVPMAPIERRIASQLEAEILRRGSRR